jgi:hypothetical protein
MSEAASCSGEFAHWSEDRRNERVAYLFSLVEKHAMFAIGSAVHHEMYQSVFRDRLDDGTRFLEYPYFLSYWVSLVVFLNIVWKRASQHNRSISSLTASRTKCEGCWMVGSFSFLCRQKICALF